MVVAVAYVFCRSMECGWHLMRHVPCCVTMLGADVGTSINYPPVVPYCMGIDST